MLPSILAGTAFATCAYVSVHLLGHVNLTHAWVLPLAAGAWTSFVARPSSARASGVALAFAIPAWSDYYYLVYAGLFALVWLALTAWDLRMTWPVTRHPLFERTLLAVAGVAAVVAAAIWVTGGIAFDVGAIHVTAQRARNPSSVAGICLLAWIVARTRRDRDPRH